VVRWRIKGVGGEAASLKPPSPLKKKFKGQRFCRHDDIRNLNDLNFRQNQPLKSAVD
jgi:hypothetical protein